MEVWIAVGAILAAIAWILLPPLLSSVANASKGRTSALNRRLPDAWFHSRHAPPWRVPRTVRETGWRRDLADFRMLRRRLDHLRRLPERPVDYVPPELLIDRETGQHWVLTLEEAGFNQWFELNPVEGPPAAPPNPAPAPPDS